MSYQVIARKWRPQSFDEVSGQSHVTTALRNAIRSERIPHAMLFTGPRGVGKTTLARLIARCLNCEKGPTDEPCGACPACVEITEGRSTDVQEIDAASRTGVDDMREVIESIRYAAAPGKHRIYIIDEVHMLSTPAFNALLKTLEEPPPRSLFIFATTNPEKIPFTVLSRCQRHDLRRIALTNVGERLAEICAAEGIEISPAALASIAREGDGSMRDAQTLLDQIVAYAGGQSGTKITDETVADLLDLVDGNLLRGIVEACIDHDTARALEHVAQATSGGSEARRIAEALLSLLRDLTVLGVAPEAPSLFDGPDEQRAELLELAGKTEPARLRRMFRALMREIEDLSFAPNPTAVLEMAVIRLATMPTGDDVAQLLSRLDQLDRRLASGAAVPGGAGGGGGRAPTGPGGGPRARSESGAGAPAGRKPAPKRTAPDDDGFDAPPASASATASRAAASTAPSTGQGVRPTPSSPSSPRSTHPTPPAAPTPPAPAKAPGNAPSSGSLGGGAPPAALFDRLRARALELDRSRFASLDGAELLRIDGATIALGVTGQFHADRLTARLAELETIASELFSQPTRVTVEIAQKRTAREESHDTREQSRRQRQEALNSESVNLAIEVLGAEIAEIRPLGEKR